MTLLFQYPAILLIACTLVAAGAAAWGYARTIPPLPRSRKLLLAGLRFGAFFLITFLLFEPIARRTATITERPVVAVLLDDSQSTAITSTETDTSEIDGAPSFLENVLARLSLPDDVEVRAYRFSSDAQALQGSTGDWAEQLNSQGERTDVSSALRTVGDDLRDQNLAGVVLVSDGRYNTGSNPIYLAERYPVPVHTVVVGDTTSRRDVLVDRIVANQLAYVSVEQPIEVEIQASGFAGARLTVQLLDGGRELATSTVNVAGDEARIPVSLSYVPDTPGLRTLSVQVSTLPGELTHENNRQVLPVRVLEEKRQVLLLAGAPSPDVAAVRQVLKDDSNMELTVRVQKDGSEFYEGAFPRTLEPFDAIVLVGFPGPATQASQLRSVGQALDNGTPGIFILTQSTNLALFGSELGDAFPASTAGDRGGWLEALPIVSPDGAQHPVMAVEGVTASDWKRLPPLMMSESRWTPSPDARVLATAEVRGVPLGDPLIVIRSRGASRSVSILGAGVWRWKNVPSDLAQWEHLFPSMLSNSLQWVTAARDQRQVRVRPARDVFAGGESIRFSGEVYDESLRPLSGAAVELELTSEDGRSFPFRMEDVGNGRYQLDAGGLPEGTYSYEVAAKQGDASLGTDSGSFAIGGLTLEHRDTRADPGLMRQIAARSGGVSLHSSEAGSLASQISQTATLEPRAATTVSETNLRREPVFLFLIVLLLTTEWIIRKRSGLV